MITPHTSTNQLLIVNAKDVSSKLKSIKWETIPSTLTKPHKEHTKTKFSKSSSTQFQISKSEKLMKKNSILSVQQKELFIEIWIWHQESI